MSGLVILPAVLGINGALTYASFKFLPTTLLRLAPLVSSHASLIWAYDEYTAFSAWTDPAYRAKADALLPAWFKNWAKKGNYVLFTTFFTSMSTGLANVLSLSATGNTSWSLDSPRLWYGLGAFFALAHMFFGGKALGLLAEIQQKGKLRADGTRASPTDAMGRWLRMHSLRTPTTDLPAVICFLTGACFGLKAM